MKGQRLSKREFANQIGKSPRTVERWIKDHTIPKKYVYRDIKGHVFIHKLALKPLFVSENLYHLTNENLRRDHVAV